MKNFDQKLEDANQALDLVRTELARYAVDAFYAYELVPLEFLASAWGTEIPVLRKNLDALGMSYRHKQPAIDNVEHFPVEAITRSQARDLLRDLDTTPEISAFMGVLWERAEKSELLSAQKR